MESCGTLGTPQTKSLLPYPKWFELWKRGEITFGHSRTKGEASLWPNHKWQPVDRRTPTLTHWLNESTAQPSTHARTHARMHTSSAIHLPQTITGNLTHSNAHVPKVAMTEESAGEGSRHGGKWNKVHGLSKASRTRTNTNSSLTNCLNHNGV